MAVDAEDYSNVGEYGVNVQVDVDVPVAEGVALARRQPPGDGVIYEKVTTTSDGTYWFSLDGSAVPAGEVWVITAADAADTDNMCEYVYIRVRTDADGDQVVLAASRFQMEDVNLCWQGQICLEAGHFLRALFGGSTAGDELTLRYWGYKVKV